MNDLIGDERLSVGSYPVLGLDPPDCPSKWQMTVSLLRNQIITHFQTLLHLGSFGPMFCCSVSSLLKKIFWNYFPILGQLHGLTLPDSLPRASSLNSYSSSDLSNSQQWLRFPAVVQALWLDTHTYMNTYLYTDLYIYYTHAHTQNMYACMYKNTAWNFSSHVPKLYVYTCYGNSGKTQKVTSIFYIHTAHLLKHDFKRP